MILFYILLSVKYCINMFYGDVDMKMIEPDFWMGRGRYSKRALREAAVDKSPIEKTSEAAGDAPEEAKS